MKKPSAGTERPRVFAVDFGPSWERWARHRTDEDLESISNRLTELVKVFGQPHLHSGLGLRRLTPRLFEFRISRALRVVFAFIKPGTLQLAMCGSHDEVRRWVKENA